MNEPLSWIWVAQVVVIIAAAAAGLLAIMWVALRGRPTWHHVVTHEVNKTWEEIKAEIEARERVKPQWVYHGTHDQRHNGSRADGTPSRSS
jgi:flagellar basal body-associated protein FliL